MIGPRPIILNGCCGVLLNKRGEVLLQERNEPARRWGLPGGLMEMGETTQQTVVREVREESGLELDPEDLHLLNVYSGPDHHVVAPNGDEFFNVVIAYYARGIDGAVRVSDGESLAYAWVPLTSLPANMVATHLQAINDYLKLHQ
ncbi:NUDIX hydrolase [Lacticaseibacillus hulanensis]|uniref:NUDIX hydrolase n=1 Tax=Lacticaseibacillus hulanensis TaxID=2493111 RepID=UPI0013E2F684|nr:NUDIX domain-containing protein [Lacticaseibacillus hulanensis]